MKKILLITVGSLAIVGAIAYYTYHSMSKESVAIKETTSENDGGKIIEIKETNVEPIEEEFPTDMTEYAVQNAIHGMSHQKVRADDKWGFIPLTTERVTRLKAVVEANEYEEEGLYLDILNRWSKNDFSQVDQDHNAIWDLQNGTIGKATGILSADEEKAFIEMHFDIE
ncbi:DUF6241 domain-containing protein [Cytobacillus firmus]|uniref:DUF6241 domain-containing protein n=1 Tax=Cytobacillus firmus TaxID=1399 RepID=UPI0018CC9221|nr:DUF6241 domain-containing protein [Cytobacillus firmus]MBG9589535.1 hypothetical protein [Cytobacillus firmus]